MCSLVLHTGPLKDDGVFQMCPGYDVTIVNNGQ